LDAQELPSEVIVPAGDLLWVPISSRITNASDLLSVDKALFRVLGDLQALGSSPEVVVVAGLMVVDVGIVTIVLLEPTQLSLGPLIFDGESREAIDPEG